MVMCIEISKAFTDRTVELMKTDFCKDIRENQYTNITHN